MAYVPPWRRAGGQPRTETLFKLHDIEDALPGVGSHTFVVSYTENEEAAPSLCRIMRHERQTDASLPSGQYDLWTRNHIALLQQSVGTRLPLFLESPTYTGPRGMRGKDSRKLYDYSGWHAIDSVVVHQGGSSEVEAFLKERDKLNKRKTPEEVFKRNAQDSWACVRIRKCDEEVQQAFGSPMQKWIDKGRPPRPRPAAENAEAATDNVAVDGEAVNEREPLSNRFSALTTEDDQHEETQTT